MKKNIVFLCLLLVFLIAFDYGLSLWGENACSWATNDYEATKLSHPEEVWDKVFFGNSAVISAYLEDESESGFINFGIDYGVITDIRDILEQGHIEISSELVIGLNFFTFCDDFETNPNYIWHREFYEPYAYFHRDKLMDLIRSKLGIEDAPKSWNKILYYGTLSDAELDEKMKTYHAEYFSRPFDAFENNLEALEDVINFCKDNHITLRLVWMPFNPSVEHPEILSQLQTRVAEISAKHDIEILDFTLALDESCFHDVGHLNREHGAYIFTAKIDPWLNHEEVEK